MDKSDAIEWCCNSIKDVQFVVGGEYPPLPIEDNKFDLIYAISVFTHVDEDHQFKWLKELKRLSTRNANLMLTFRDPVIVESFKDGGIKNKVQQGLAEKGISFVHNKGWQGVFPDWYGGAYHTFEYVRSQWGRYFDVVDISRPIGAVSQCIALLRSK